MKQLCARLLVIAVFGSLLATAGCVLDGSDLVITENVCVDINEVQTDGSFTTFAVAETFKEQLDKKLKENGKSPKDVKSIHMVGATFKTVKVDGSHDWTFDADFDIARDDNGDFTYEDGPAPLATFEDQSFYALKGGPNTVTLLEDGVALVDRALADLLTGDDPRLVLLVRNEDVDPDPSESDPLSFTTNACVKFQIVIGKAENPASNKR